MANKVTTQWFDLQVKHGNYLANQKQTTLYEQQKQMKQHLQQAIKIQNILDSKNQQQLQQLQDDLDFDDQFTKQYYQNRMKDLKEKAQKIKYGQVMQIARDQYVRQVTNAPVDDFVLIHLYQDSNEFCTLINHNLPDIAKRYGQVKFIKMIATKCIDKFPDSSCPCFIIYKAGKPVSHITNVDKHLKGKMENIDLFFKSHGIEEV